MAREPAAELAQVVFDVSDGARSQACGDLLDVAVGGTGESRCDGWPSGHRRGRFRRGAVQGGEVPGVEQGQLQAVEQGGHGPPGTRLAPAGVDVGHGGSGAGELVVADRAGSGTGDRGDLGERVPLHGGVRAGNFEPRTDFAEPAVIVGAVQPCRVAEPQVGGTE